MLLKKKIVVISLALAVILAVGACYYYFAIYNSVRDVYSSSTYKGFSTAKALFSDADLVVIGSPIKDFEDREVEMGTNSLGGIMYIVTSTEIKVEKVLKGPEEGFADLTILEPIGVRQTLTGKERYATEGYTEMKKGSKYLIFLGKNTSGQYSVINMQAGKFNLDGTDSDDSKGSPGKQSIFTEIKTNFSQELK
ncbi:hypothetical protein [Paenibacillus sp. 1001270B_150601_E10]|uniref:hypothetical protein n=1 Tax=Paenibacillus sp. 1001270B_150601_E10 TaxID=2787079 RepID=UPI00189CBA8B|nr:hypothetical protein [Paenibacillus sp. 1001270B_150601_E10]